VPTPLGRLVPDVPAPVVLDPVVLRVRRLRVVDPDVPRRRADVPGAHGTESTAEFWFAATEPSAAALLPVRFEFAVALALPEAAPVVLALPLAFVLPFALAVLFPLALPRAAAEPERRVVPVVAVDGVHGVVCAPVCAPGDVVLGVLCDPWLDRVDGVDVDGDDVLPDEYWATAGTASARLSATPPAHVITFLLTCHLRMIDAISIRHSGLHAMFQQGSVGDLLTALMLERMGHSKRSASIGSSAAALRAG
jgi:hypothetical protein